MSGMLQVVFRAPVAAVNVHHHRKRARSFGNAQLAELIGIGAVGQAGVGGWRREREDVVCRHNGSQSAF